jgi:RHS repeat-associated protein
MPGQFFDKSTNLFYNYFRDYDPQLGRYVQSDPIGLVGGINTYGYVAGNPVSLADPLGLVNPGTAAGAGFGTLLFPGLARSLEVSSERGWALGESTNSHDLAPQQYLLLVIRPVPVA